ncbi:MAG: hypothetical protein ACRD8U_05155 [Pyrinomonadaceae bacterium]
MYDPGHWAPGRNSHHGSIAIHDSRHEGRAASFESA